MDQDSQRLAVAKEDLARALSDVLGLPVLGIEVSALGASSRGTPWRVELRTSIGHRTVLVRLGASCSSNEVIALEAMKSHPLPTPEVLYWEPEGIKLGKPFFVSTFIEGASLLNAMKTNEPWADALYISTACALQSIKREDLPPDCVDQMEGSKSALEVLERAYRMFEKPNRLADAAYQRLKATQPESPVDHFSNGDLWPDNLLVQGKRLVGIIDWQHADFGDPIYEFLLPFFLVPEIRGRGTEQIYCQEMGFDPVALNWYHGLEFFDSLSMVLKLGRPYGIHTAASLRRDLQQWLKS